MKLLFLGQKCAGSKLSGSKMCQVKNAPGQKCAGSKLCRVKNGQVKNVPGQKWGIIGWERERDGVRKTVLSKRRVNSIGKKKKETKSCCAAHHNFFFALDRSKITITTTTSWLKNWARDCELWVLWSQVLWFKMSMVNRKAGAFFLILMTFLTTAVFNMNHKKYHITTKY